ncbi:hypothetical protein JXL21_09910 [Candidatus Bathyarchaeota archaeon]|nr:hypothetical protein [Candidatus Bathyarchaeota archaeon]
MINVRTEDSNIIDSTSVSVSNLTIDELYDNTIKLCKKKYLFFWDNWKITYAYRQNHHIMMEGIPFSFIFPRGNLWDRSIWDVRFVQKPDKVEVTLSLLPSLRVSWFPIKEETIAKYLFPQVASYLFNNIGVKE